MRTRSPRRLAGLLALLLLATAPVAKAGDLIEPYDPGLSDLELWFSRGEGGPLVTTFFAGVGLDRGLSAGASITRTGGEAWRAGAFGLFTTRVGGAELDLFVDGGVLTPDNRRHPRETDLLAGTELSWKFRRTIPYLRLSRVLDGDLVSWRPLAGLAIPFGAKGRLHIEAASQSFSTGGPHRSYSIGPKIFLRRMDLLVELARSWEPGAPEGRWIATAGVVFYPKKH